MTDTTRAAIKAVAATDTTMTDAERATLAALLQGGDGRDSIQGLMTRREVAALVRKTPQMVDQYARRGLIRRVTLGNSSRASGFDAESVRAFLAGRTATATTGARA